MSLQFNGTNGITYNDGTLQSTAYTGSSSGGGDGGDYTPEPMVWENVTASKNVGITYTNTNDVPLYVNLSSGCTSDGIDTSFYTFNIDGVAFNGGVGGLTTMYDNSLYIVPSGSTYSIDITRDCIIYDWQEARMPVAVGTGGSGGGEVQPPVAFDVSGTSNTTTVLNSGDKLVYDNVVTNEGDNYSLAENAFIAKKEGVYNFSSTVFNVDATNPSNTTFYVNGVEIQNHRLIESVQYNTSSGSIVLKLNANDKVQVGRSSVVGTSSINMAQCNFSGSMISSITGGSGGGGVPSVDTAIGMVAPFAMDSVPTGWLHCDGSAVSRTTYSSLYSKVADLYGAGDGSTTFNLPNLQDEFVRGSSDTLPVGTKQDDALQNITGSIFNNTVGVQGGAGTGPFEAVANPSATYRQTIEETPGAVINFDASKVARTADETRPRNVAMLYCINATAEPSSGGGDAYTKEESDAIDNAQDVKIVINNDDIARQQIEITNNTAEIGKNTSAINTNIINIAQNSEDIAELQDSIFFTSAYSANYPSAANRDPEDGNMYLQAFALFTYSYASATQIFCSKTDEAGNVRQFTAIKAGDSVVLNEVDSSNYGRYELVSIEEVSESYVVMNVIPKLGEGTIVAGVKVAFQAFPKVGIWTNIDGVATYDGDIKVNGVTVGKGSSVNNGDTTIVGKDALKSDVSGQYNTAIGSYCLQTNLSGESNTAVGYGGLSQSTSGKQNTSIGHGAGSDVTVGNNNTFIGYNAQPSAPTVSNEVTIGNDDVTSTRLNGTVSTTGSAIIGGDLDVGSEFSFRALSTSATIATSQPTTWSCAKDFIKLACGDGSGARLLVQDNGIVNVEGSFTVNGAPVTTTVYVKEQLAIKDKIIEALEARLTKLEKRIK